MVKMNVFRVLGDISHTLSKCILIVAILRNKSAEGVSLITQAFYAIIFCTRYLDIFYTPPSFSYWNFILKIFYTVSSFYILYLMLQVYARTREREKAWKLGAWCLGGSLVTTPIILIFFPDRLGDTLVVFSLILESVCVLPQLLLLRQTSVPTVIDSFYLLTLGSYRAFYILNWIEREYDDSSGLDPIAIIFGCIQTALYVDFAWIYYSRQRVKLRSGGLVDGEDLRRGWLVGSIFGKRFNQDEESTPALEGEEEEDLESGTPRPGPPRKGTSTGWGKRGISVTADDSVMQHERERQRLREAEDLTARDAPDAKMRDPDELAMDIEDDSDDDALPSARATNSGRSDNVYLTSAAFVYDELYVYPFLQVCLGFNSSRGRSVRRPTWVAHDEFLPIPCGLPPQIPDDLGKGPERPRDLWLSVQSGHPFSIKSSDGSTLYAWHILPIELYREHESDLIAEPTGFVFDVTSRLAFKMLREDPEARLILHMHGAAGTVGSGYRPPNYRALSAGQLGKIHVLTFDYRGFGRSKGTPSEEGLIFDGLSIVNWAMRFAGIPPSRILIFGQSMGTGVSIALAEHFALQDPPVIFAGTVLVAPFVDIPTLVTTYRITGVIPILSPIARFPAFFKYLQTFIRDKWLNKDRIADYIKANKANGEKYRLTLIHAEDDYDIPWHHTPTLFWHAVNATVPGGISYDELDLRKIESKTVLGAAGSVMEWRTGNGFIREEILKTGLHDVVIGYPIISMAVMRIFGAADPPFK